MENVELQDLQRVYKAAVEDWIAAIRAEEDLASGEPTIEHVDQWERAHFEEDEARNRALRAKKEYEGALRKARFHF